MKLREILKSLNCAVIIILFSCLARAELPVGKLVEVELLQDNLAPYKIRREDHGAAVEFKYESLVLQEFISILDASTYEQLFGEESIPLAQLGIEYKYNFSLGSVAAGLEYGKGRLSDSLSGTERSLDISKYGVGLTFIADMILDEPYVAPYVGIHLWQMEVAETSPTESFSATTQMGMNYTAGLLLQLDWIDYESSKYATFQWGLENTFIDLYVTKYAKTSAEDDPNTETDFLYGGGLRLEF